MYTFSFNHLSFLNLINRASTTLQLVHLDLMGQIRTHYCVGFHYLLVFIYGFSRLCWVYFLENKSEVFSNFILFKSQVEKKVDLLIKCLPTNNSGEIYLIHCLNIAKKWNSMPIDMSSNPTIE